MQHYDECYCGDTYGRYGKADEADCNTECVGNSTQMCGGAWRISVYSAISGKLFYFRQSKNHLKNRNQR